MPRSGPLNNDAELPADSKIRKSADWKKLRERKPISSPIIITHTDPEDVMGPFDFSKAAIDRRTEQGFRDGLAKLG